MTTVVDGQIELNARRSMFNAQDGDLPTNPERELALSYGVRKCQKQHLSMCQNLSRESGVEQRFPNPPTEIQRENRLSRRTKERCK